MSIKIEIKVFPKSPIEKIVESEGILRVYVKNAPDKGKANKDVISVIAKRYGVRKKDVVIIKGRTNRNKIVEVKYNG